MPSAPVPPQSRGLSAGRQYIYVNARIQHMIDVIGTYLQSQPYASRGLTRKTRGKDDRAFNRSIIAQVAVEHWAKKIAANEKPQLDVVRGYALEYANALMVEPGIRRLIYVSDAERSAFDKNLDIIHVALKPFRDDLPVLMTRARTKAPNDVLVLTMAICKMADDLVPRR